MPSTFILAVDVGAGSLRAGLVRTSGRVEAAAAIPLAIAVPRRGWAELDPERWWQALRTASARVLRALPRSGRVLAVCICGLTRTQVLLDQRGRTVGRAIAFRDARAAAIARELDGTSAFGPGGHLKLLHLWPGQIPPPDAVGRV